MRKLRILSVLLVILICFFTDVFPYDTVAPINFGSAQVDNSSPVIADIRTDIAGKEIVVGCLDGFVYMFNAQGTQIASFDAKTGVDSSPAVADINLDGDMEIIVGIGSLDSINTRNYHGGIAVLDKNLKVIWCHQGTLVQAAGEFGSANMPFKIPENLSYVVCDGYAEFMESSPAIANVDSDPEMEIFIGSLDHNFYGFNHDGTLLDSLTDDDGDGKFNEDPGHIRDGSEGTDDDKDSHSGVLDGCNTFSGACIDEDPPDWPVDNQDTTFSSPAVGDIDGDGIQEIIFGGDSTQTTTGGSFCNDGGKLWYLKPKGNAARVNNHPMPIGYYPMPNGNVLCKGQIFASSPALADIDGNGTLEVFIGTGNYGSYLSNTDTNKVFAFNSAGGELNGWPYDCGSGQFTRSSPAIADVNGDGVLDIVICSGDYSGGSKSKIHAIDSLTGRALPGFPVMPIDQAYVISSPVIADINNDLKADIIVGMNNRVFVYDGSGNQLMHVQCLSFMPFQNSLAVDDIDNDGKVEIVGCAGNLDSPSKAGLFIIEGGHYNPGTHYWPMFRRNAKRTGLYSCPGTYLQITGTSAPDTILTFYNSDNSILGTTQSDSSGNYFYTQIPTGWSGKLVPVKDAHTFTPAERSYNDLSENQSNQDFTGAIAKYTISGKTLPDTIMVFVTAGGVELGSTKSNASGEFSFSDAYFGWSGILYPRREGSEFTPEYIGYTKINQDYSAQNFTAVSTDKLRISGWVLPDASVMLYNGSGSILTTLTADSNGFFIYDQIPVKWSGEILPTSYLYKYEPLFKTLTNLQYSTNGLNFTTEPSNKLRITGWTIGEALFTFFNDDGTWRGNASASVNGFYAFQEVPPTWSGKFYPAKADWEFEPEDISVSNMVNNLDDANFKQIPVDHLICGFAQEGANVEFKSINGDILYNATADSSHYYSCSEVPYGWSGTITPTHADYFFTPEFLTITNLPDNLYNMNFAAVSKYYTAYGWAAADTEIVFVGDNGTTITTMNTGTDMTFTYDKIPFGWSGKIIPHKEGFVFEPEYLKISDVKDNVYDLNFEIYSAYFTISGWATNDVEITFTNWSGGILYQTETEDYGYYECTIIPYNWDGFVTLKKTGVTFEPSGRSYFNVKQNYQNENYAESSKSSIQNLWVLH